MIFNELTHDSKILARSAWQKISAFLTTIFVSEHDVRAVLAASAALHRTVDDAPALRDRRKQRRAAGVALEIWAAKNKYDADLHFIRLPVGVAYND